VCLAFELGLCLRFLLEGLVLGFAGCWRSDFGYKTGYFFGFYRLAV
jgi:hypothetical protein